MSRPPPGSLPRREDEPLLRARTGAGGRGCVPRVRWSVVGRAGAGSSARRGLRVPGAWWRASWLSPGRPSAARPLAAVVGGFRSLPSSGGSAAWSSVRASWGSLARSWCPAAAVGPSLLRLRGFVRRRRRRAAPRRSAAGPSGWPGRRVAADPSALGRLVRAGPRLPAPAALVHDVPSFDASPARDLHGERSRGRWYAAVAARSAPAPPLFPASWRPARTVTVGRLSVAGRMVCRHGDQHRGRRRRRAATASRRAPRPSPPTSPVKRTAAAAAADAVVAAAAPVVP